MRPAPALSALAASACLLLIASRHSSFVDSAPVDEPPRQQSQPHSGAETAEDQPQANFDEVKQLEDLKNSFGKTFSVLKSHSATYSDVNGERRAHSQTDEEAREDGRVVAHLSKTSEGEAAVGATPSTRTRVELSLPQLGVHAVAGDSPQQQPRQPGNNQEASRAAGAAMPPQQRRRAPPETAGDKLSSYAGIQYSPQDMAEYVFWTGDEKGVTLAIEEFLQEGLMTREEAIRFLQDIKLNLDLLQQQFSQQKQQEQQMAKDRATLLQKALGLDKPEVPVTSEPKLLPQDNEVLQNDKKNTGSHIETNKVSDSSDEDYEELLERLKVVDFLYTEYSLEEVIYQLAKIMFTQSLTRGSAEAQSALQKFTAFLEAEAEQGHISRSLEKKVLDVLIASLTDTLSEKPQLLAAAREGLANGAPLHTAPATGGLGAGSAGGASAKDQMLLRQLLSLAPTAQPGSSRGRHGGEGEVASDARAGSEVGAVGARAHSAT
ncbi:uncharacterized protein LOC126428137 [Schistocerca serialis cubense]|uniref:uncharacterized protein LOC126428137 n=1 Tax=Schistocerca serialis cubense TaxID=2023355 RepID=UPI00214F5DBB|nr:uncharacterized protein LOC126428137 [Schistocerca serialis cubense]